MKKYLITLFCFVLCININAHEQHTHQYIAVQGYKLLSKTLRINYPKMQNNLGAFESSSGDRPWEVGTITAGAYREDLEDVVYDYGGIVGWVGGATSITHFFDPDDGDLQTNTFDIKLAGIYARIGPYENAYQKMLKYINGGWTINYIYGTTVGCPSAAFGTVQGDLILGIAFEYSDLVQFFTTGTILAKGHQDLSGNWSYCTPSTVYFGEEFREKICWQILGRMCHLLQDMSVPAHVHRDAHGLADDGIRHDSYERYFGYDFGFDFYSVYNSFNGFINPIGKTNPVHFLMYTTAQMSDHFGSNGPYEGDGNNTLGGNGNSDEITYLNSLNISSFGNPVSLTNPLSDSEILNIRSKMMPQAIRTTAGLLYWFATQVGLSSIPISTQGYLTQNENWMIDNTLTGNVYVPSGTTLTIENSAIINLNNYSIISSGGTISLSSGATINGLKAKTTGSALKGICGKLQDAIDVADAYDDIEVSDVTINENISIVDKTNINLHDVDLNGNISMTNSDYMVLQDNTCNNIYISNCDYPWIWRVVVEGSGSGNGVSMYNVGFLSPYGNSSISVDNFENGMYAIASTFGMESNYYSMFTNVENGVVGYANANLTLNSVNLCDVSDYHLISSYGSYIYANGCYYYNGTPIVQETAGTVETVSNQSCGSLPKVSTSEENIMIAYSEDEFGKINNKLREFSERISSEMEEKGKFSAKDYKDEILDIADLYKQYVTNTESKCRGAALTTAVHCYKAVEDYESMKDFLEELKDDAEIGGYAERYLIDYYRSKKEFENAIKTADELLSKGDGESDNIVLYSKGLVLAHDMNEPEQASICFSTIIENDADKGLKALAENQLGILGYEVDKSVTISGKTESNGIELDNYPNPFNPSTTISYTLPEAGAVQIKIYDILGREVAKLVDEQKSAGKYTVQWNGSNYASGIYFYSVTFGGQRLYKKMLMIK